MPQSYPEGQRLQGSDGKVYVIRNGAPVAENAASGPRPVMSTPGDPLKAPLAQADLTGKNLSNDRARVELDPATIAANRAKAVADARKAGYDADAAAVAARKADKPPATAANILANDELLQTIARARQHLTKDSAATGGYAFLSGIPGTESKQLKNLIDTIRANVTFDRLQQMRNESSTGGAVGNASDNDMRLMGSTTAALDQSASASDLSKSLDAIERRYLGLRADMLGQPRDKFFQSYYSGSQKQASPIALPPVLGGSGPGPTSGSGPLGPNGGASGGDGSGAPTIDTQFKEVPNDAGQKYWAAIAPLFKAGKSDAEIEAASVALGAPSGLLNQNFADRRKYGPRFNAVPGEGLLKTKVPLSTGEKIANTIAANPDAAFVGEAGNAAGAGIPQAIMRRFGGENTGRMLDAARNTNPTASTLGQLAGTAGGAVGAELLAAKGLTRLGVESAAKWAPRVGDFGFGSATGATGNPDHPFLGAAVGGPLAMVSGMGGRQLGRSIVAPTAGKLFGIPRPGAADSEVTGAINAAGPDAIRSSLTEARGLNLPMSLADTAPQLQSLAGAAVRRSPNAAAIARANLQPRAAGQIDRLGTAIERDLGPIGNVPQISKGLQKTAGANAEPLYRSAYTQSVDDPAISSLMSNPQMGDAMTAARMFRDQDATLARARGLPEPPPLAEPGGPVDIRTIDYLKRGMDGRINTAFTGGDPQAAMSGPFLKQARGIMLNAADTAVPDYAAARAAYAGPMRAQEALDLGQGAVKPSVTANQLGVDLAGVEPGNIPQAQLGYRSAMMDAANKSRFSTNPFDAVLGSPQAEAKLGAMYPDNPGNANLLRQRDLERMMQATNNDILGGSQTAVRGIADQSFQGDGLNLATGAVADSLSGAPINTGINIAKRLGKGMFGARADAKAVAKADRMAPGLLTPDASASLEELARLLSGYQRYQRFSRVPTAIGGIGGASSGAGVAGMLGR